LSIALDAMGGDYAPQEIIAGALLAAPQLKSEIILVGDKTTIESFLPAEVPNNIKVVHASQIVEMGEKPLDAYRRKKDSSLMVCVNLVKEGHARGIVSAGSTGAAVAFSLLGWRQVPGIHRPAIGTPMPNRSNGFVLLDSGASPDVDPEHMVEFAVMGRAYAERVMGRTDPGVHLLNIGEEEGKGNAFAKKAYELLKPYPWFKGNIEGKDIFNTRCDVVVCEAFVGNVVLKTAEGVAEMFSKIIKEGIPSNPVLKAAYWPVKKVMAPLRRRADYAETGGSPLLGLNGVCVIAHGRSNAKAVMNALLMAEKSICGDLVNTIRSAAEPLAAKAQVEVNSEQK
jgi:glycerol-3-phosphate acyltransferase PlsX